jgi:hypothetical protein
LVWSGTGNHISIPGHVGTRLIKVSFGGRWRGYIIGDAHDGRASWLGCVWPYYQRMHFAGLSRHPTPADARKKNQNIIRLLDIRDHEDGGIMEGGEAACQDGTGRSAWMRASCFPIIPRLARCLCSLSTRVFTKTHGARHNPLSCFPSLPFRPLTFYLIFLLLLFSLVSCLE